MSPILRVAKVSRVNTREFSVKQSTPDQSPLTGVARPCTK